MKRNWCWKRQLRRENEWLFESRLSNRAFNILMHAGLQTRGQVLSLADRYSVLWAEKQCGAKTIEEIRQFVHELQGQDYPLAGQDMSHWAVLYPDDNWECSR